MTTDFLVIGSGVAGLRAALELSTHGRVVLATKEQPTESATAYAQGGIAVALAEDDAVELHLEDTLAAGAGIVSPSAARVLVDEGPDRVRELVAWGARFDRSAGRHHFTREAAHSRSRVLHALGDATGWEIVRALLGRLQSAERIEVRPASWATALEVEEGRVVGCRFVTPGGRDAERLVLARATLLATGGASQVFAETTNPSVVTGDGMSLALRAGAALADLEFVQFHPTALAAGAEPLFLISEAVRGEGGLLRNASGERFTEELKPRDQVARAIFREQRAGRGPVTLDVRHLDEERIRTRFPRIFARCRQNGFDMTRDLVPVTPAAHYVMGGILTDLGGRTTVRGLYAAGEAAATGVHGANRLASNSLLEGLVFGLRAARAMADDGNPEPGAGAKGTTLPAAGALPPVEELRRRAWEGVGVEREAAGLGALVEWLEPFRGGGRPRSTERVDLIARSLADVCWAMARSAQFREESRGGHFRGDYPELDDARFFGHTVLDAQGPRLAPVDGFADIVAERR